MEAKLTIQADVAGRIVRHLHSCWKEIEINRNYPNQFRLRDTEFWFADRETLVMNMANEQWAMTTSTAAADNASVASLYDKIVPGLLNAALLKRSPKFFQPPKSDDLLVLGHFGFQEPEGHES